MGSVMIPKAEVATSDGGGLSTGTEGIEYF